MKNKYKLYFISDIHSNYEAMIKTLEENEYNENNPNHLLIVLGDIFDRCENSLKVYKYLKRLTSENKAIVTSGNHHKFLIDFLEGSDDPFNYINNGLSNTLADFWHRTAPFESWCLLEGGCEMSWESYIRWANICRNDIKKEYPELLPWLKSLPRYFESQNYIGVHGALDLNVIDWHYPHCYKYNLIDWDALDFDDGSFLTRKNNTGKTIILGHYGTDDLRKKWFIDTDNIGNYDILKTNDNKIFIDTCTVITNRVNVYIVEDELLDNNEKEGK